MLFGTGGSYPFPFTSFLWATGLCAAAAIATDDRAVRVACVMYAAIATATFVLSSPLGANIGRMPLFLAAPLVVMADPARTRRMLTLAAVPVVAVFQTWQIAEVAAATTIDPSTSPEYYEGVVSYLRAQPQPVRVEIPMTKQHWETVYVAENIPIARGWERQIDRGVNPEFYDPEHPPTAASYFMWLTRTGVTHVALPDTLLDTSSLAEGALIRAGLPYLRPVWHDTHWTVYSLTGAAGLVDGPASLRSIDARQVVLDAQPGAVTVRVRSSPYWQVTDGDACVQPSDDGWIHLQVPHAGIVTLQLRLDVRDMLDRRAEPECVVTPR
jgi:hypothetical protein